MNSFEKRAKFFKSAYEALVSYSVSPYAGWDFNLPESESNVAKFLLSPILLPATVVTMSLSLVLAVSLAILNAFSLIVAAFSFDLDEPRQSFSTNHC